VSTAFMCGPAPASRLRWSGGGQVHVFCTFRALASISIPVLRAHRPGQSRLTAVSAWQQRGGSRLPAPCHAPAVKRNSSTTRRGYCEKLGQGRRIGEVATLTRECSRSVAA
jgi:hypothetical protein